MGNFNVNFGKKSGSLNENDLKGGIKRSEIDDKKLLSIFDALDNGNKILEKSELQALKDKIVQFAGEDKDKSDLSKKEAKHLIKSLNLNIKTSDLFNFLSVLKLSSAKINECITDEDTKEVTISYADDDETAEKYDKDGNMISKSKKASYDGRNGKLTQNRDGSLEFSYHTNSVVKLGGASFDMSQDIKLHFPSQEAFDKKQPDKKIFSTNGGNEQVEEYTYHQNGKLSSKKQISNGKLSNEYKYDESGNVLEHVMYNTEGKLLKRTVKTWNGNKPASEKVYDSNNKLKSEAVFDENGKIKEKTEYINNPYGEAGYSKVVTKYTDGVIKQENYLRTDGTLFRKNEYSNGELKKQTEYFPDGVHKKLEIIYEGENVSTIEYDITGKVIKKTSSLPDGYFGPSKQRSQGDCYLMASINAIRNTTNGQKILSNLIKKNGSSYTVTLPGAKKAAQGLLTDRRIKKNKMYITGTYTFTATELQDIMRQAGTRYSEGDPDVMLLEAAFEKYRMEVLKTMRANNIRENMYGVAGLQTGEDSNNILYAGHAVDAIYILTGQKSQSYYNYNQQYQMPDSEAWGNDNSTLTYMKAQTEIISETDSKNKLNQMLNDIMNDNSDGHIDCVATCTFNMEDGNGHVFTIKSVTKDKVVLINPWEPERTITMTRKEFVQKVLSVTLAKIPYTPVPDDNNGGNDIVTPPQDNPVQQEPEPNTGDGNITIVKTVTISHGQGYSAFIKEQLVEQGIIKPTAEQIAKAKQQFEAANPKTDGSSAYVHTWNQSSHPEWKGNKYLIAGMEYKVPKFDV